VVIKILLVIHMLYFLTINWYFLYSGFAFEQD